MGKVATSNLELEQYLIPLLACPRLSLWARGFSRYGRAVSLFLSGVYVVFLCFYLRVAGKRKALRVGLLSPIRRVSRILYGGVLRHPPILMKSVDFIDKCLLFIFLKNFLIFFFLCVNISYQLKKEF